MHYVLHVLHPFSLLCRIMDCYTRKVYSSHISHCSSFSLEITWKLKNSYHFYYYLTVGWANPIVFERLNKQQRLFIISNNFPRIYFSKANSDCHHAVLAYSRNMKSQCEYFSIFLVDVDIVDYTIHLIILICIRYSKRGLHPVKKCPQLLL